MTQAGIKGDYHIHTNYSDGVFSPEKIVDLALDAFRFDEDGQKIKQPKQKVVFVPNNKKYKRQYLQDAWRHEAYWKNNH